VYHSWVSKAIQFQVDLFLRQRNTSQEKYDFGPIEVNPKMAIFGFDLEDKISVCVRNGKLKTWVLKPRFENPDSWLLRKKQ
jgi:hypothetical protein